MTTQLSRPDVEILEILQSDGRVSNRDLATRVALSPSPCWRRVRALEDAGVVERYVALLAPEKLGLAVIAYAHVSLTDHHPETVEEFDAAVERAPEVLECYMTSGEHDYMLKVITADMAAYEHFLSEKMLRLRSVRTINTGFVLRRKKYTTALPLPQPG
jgi:DNA-binding Lrp family transcriptional regulator